MMSLMKFNGLMLLKPFMLTTSKTLIHQLNIIWLMAELVFHLAQRLLLCKQNQVKLSKLNCINHTQFNHILSHMVKMRMPGLTSNTIRATSLLIKLMPQLISLLNHTLMLKLPLPIQQLLSKDKEEVSIKWKIHTHISIHMSTVTMLGVRLNMMSLTRSNGLMEPKPFMLITLRILIHQLNIIWLMAELEFQPTQILLLCKEIEEIFIKWRILTLISIHTPTVITLGVKINTMSLMRFNGLMALKLSMLTISKTLIHQLSIIWLTAELEFQVFTKDILKTWHKTKFTKLRIPTLTFLHMTKETTPSPMTNTMPLMRFNGLATPKLSTLTTLRTLTLPPSTTWLMAEPEFQQTQPQLER
jgi:hypothetical protein